MPRGNPQNFIPLNKRTKEEQRKIQSMAGIASGKSRREKKTLRELLEILLETETKDGRTNADLVTEALIKQAEKGNVKAFEILRDTIGQKPVDKVETKIEIPIIKDDITE